MQILSSNDYFSKAHQGYLRVFSDPFSEETPFSIHIEKRSLISPVESILNPDVFLALQRGIGKDDICFRTTEIEPKSDDSSGIVPLVAIFKLSEFSEFLSAVNYKYAVNRLLTNAFFSPFGTWGIIANYDNFAYLGGSEAFVDSFWDNYPHSQDSQIKDFLDTWEYNFYHNDPSHTRNPSSSLALKAIFRSFCHLFGSEQAQEIFQKCSLPFLSLQ